MNELANYIRDIPDFPKPGIVFKDITPMLKDPKAFKMAIDRMQQLIEPWNVDALVGIESRGFIFGAALAYRMGLGMLAARKPGKLPYEVDQVSYDLEYGSNSLELHKDAVDKGMRVVVVDDLLATGGTAGACAQLVEKQGGIVAGYVFAVELSFLQGRKKLHSAPVEVLLKYDSE